MKLLVDKRRKVSSLKVRRQYGTLGGSTPCSTPIALFCTHALMHCATLPSCSAHHRGTGCGPKPNEPNPRARAALHPSARPGLIALEHPTTFEAPQTDAGQRGGFSRAQSAERRVRVAAKFGREHAAEYVQTHLHRRQPEASSVCLLCHRPFRRTLQQFCGSAAETHCAARPAGRAAVWDAPWPALRSAAL